MDRVPFRVISFTLFLFFLKSSSEDVAVSQALVQFMENLSPPVNVERGPNFGWNSTSDPCKDKWKGVSCDSQSVSVRKIVLDQQNLTGIFDANSLCVASSLVVLSLNGNSIAGAIPENISNCQYLTHLYLSGNSFSGSLPGSLPRLSNLKRLNLSSNGLSGQLPDLSRVSGLLSFLVQNNQFSGEIPKLNFNNLLEFNVSNNNLTGEIPDVNGRFDSSSFSGNPELCGKPLSKICPILSSPPPPSENKSKSSSKNQYLIYSGYAVLGLLLVLLVALKLMRKKKPATDNGVVENKGVGADNSSNKDSRNSNSKSEYSITSVESGMGDRSSLVILSSPVVNGLKFEDLLRAPAELVERGKHGSLYKVGLGGGLNVAVKRIKDWGISKEDFKKRMQRIDQVKHPNVLPALAYYCSKQERLLVYEFQLNGSLFSLLHGSRNGQRFDWESRLSVAAKAAEALALMHESLRDDKIPHGNLKSSNILLNKDMEPCISEYGLMSVDNNRNPSNSFKADVYGFGVILLELLTGKLVENEGFDLAGWVQSVVREEWTVEVFDKALVSEGASEERMVNLLQVALKCINPASDARPNMDQVVAMIKSIQEEEEEEDRSTIASDP